MKYLVANHYAGGWNNIPFVCSITFLILASLTFTGEESGTRLILKL